MTDSLRLTWVQPEDLIGHELRQAVEDGRDASAVAAVWRAAGGRDAPVRAGASPAPVAPELRSLAVRLLDRLDALPGAQADREPTGLAAIRAACPDWPTRPGDPGWGSAPDRRAHRRPPGAAPGTSPQGRTPHRPGTARGGGGSTSTPRTAGDDGPAPPPGPGGTATDRGGGEPTRYGPEEWVRAGPKEWVRYGPDALHAAWLGRAAGCLLGKPVEKLPLDSIRTIARATGNWPLHTWFTAKGLPDRVAHAHPWNRRSAPTSLAENIDGMPEDDDLNYPLLNLLLLQRYGRGFRTADVARLWLDELPPGRTFTAERVAFRNLLTGIEPPLTARHHNPFREWIGAAIRADVHGWTHPGDPGAAAAQAHRDACLTHTANGVYSAMFIAATIAAAARPGADAHRALATGLTVVPPSSRLAHAVRLGIEQARATTDFDTVVDRLHIAYGRYHWVHAVPNAALLAAALTHADGDFTGSICRAVSGGWDTDSNGATAGSVAGLLAGSPDALPERWTSPLKNRLATSVADFDGIGFDALAHLTHQEALRP
ncbi:ADP-ribosylglycohydrolase family protein [Streptomyces sp. NPDC020965]|uniref:ADP-ribosylglycohydrolase family protein n=1 Tax=Streptomyces sp. NPDC020965 TaxID=3365105 RepID=UPI0037A4F339